MILGYKLLLYNDIFFVIDIINSIDFLFKNFIIYLDYGF